MPELPDIEAYVTALESRLVGQTLEQVRLGSPFLVRSVAPPLSSTHGELVTGIRRLGKRIVFCLEEELFLVLHLMISGRLRWKKAGAKLPRKSGLAAFAFTNGTLILTEAGSKRRASLYVVEGEAGLAEHDPSGLEVLDADLDAFRERLTRERHTLKRSLTNPRLFSGIGNAYSDEILHRAGLSPFKLSTDLTEEESASLFEASQTVLAEWTEKLSQDLGDKFPGKVTAFHPELAVHGRYGQPCPACGTKVLRVVYAEKEVNYCARCQTGGKILADRVLSRLLKDDRPKRLDDLES